MVHRPSQRRTVSAESFRDNIAKLKRDYTEKNDISVAGYNSSGQIRRSPSKGHILAASSDQLLNEITSPYHLDYELLSDFFLTYRQFMSIEELIGDLIDRLRASFEEVDSFGRVTRVRTFVALRHWILNYFVDDFFPDLSLRTKFCDLVNELCRDLTQDERNRDGDLRILGELKKCWNHTCVLYWDIPVSLDKHNPDDEIMPGGVLGSREVSLVHHGPRATAAAVALDANGSRGRPESLAAKRNSIFSVQPGADYALNKTDAVHSPSISSASIASRRRTGFRESGQSAQIYSCSVPAPNMQARWKNRNRAPPSTMDTQGHKPDGSTKSKSQRPGHNRSGSFSDSIRDDRTPLPAPKSMEYDMSITMRIPGALVRGVLFGPSMPYVECMAPSSPVQEEPEYAFEPEEDDQVRELSERSGSMGSPGVKGIIGTFRRALSIRQSSNGGRPGSNGVDQSSQSRSRGITRRSSPTPSRSASGAPKRKLVGGRARLRIDLLSAEVAEQFNVAIRETSHSHNNSQEQPIDIGAAQSSFQQQPQDAYPRPPARAEQRLQVPHAGSHANTNVTDGSRSIVIVDDTAGYDLSVVDGQTADEMDSEMAHDIDHFRNHEGQSSSSPSHPQAQTVPIILDAEEGKQTEENEELFPSSPLEPTPPPKSEARIANAVPLIRASTAYKKSFLDKSDSANLRKFASVKSGQTEASKQQSRDDSTTQEDSTTSTDDPFSIARQGPAPQLRRRPGGDLRGREHVHSLDERSTDGTSTSKTDSPQFPVPPRGASANLVNAIKKEGAEIAQSKSNAALETSQPAMRPSFENEVAKLADLPDSESDAGTDAALLKLEGRGRMMRKLNRIEASRSPSGGAARPKTATGLPQSSRSGLKHQQYPEQVNGGEAEADAVPQMSATTNGPVPEVHPYMHENHPRHDGTAVTVRSKPQPESVGSNSSIPLLERGASHPPLQKTTQRDRQKSPTSKSGTASSPHKSRDSSRAKSSVDRLISESKATQALQRTGSQNTVNTHKSFLLDDNQSLSSDGTETPEGGSDDRHSQGMHSFFEEEEAPVNNALSDQISSLKRRGSQDTIKHGPIEPLPSSQSVEVRPETPLQSKPSNLKVNTREIYPMERPSPNPTPMETPQSAPVPKTPGGAPAAAHLPYILAYDSLLLAQQLTLVEKDALAEIEWRDLIDMKWNQSPKPVNHWVEYLKIYGQDPTGHLIRGGVDICIARFNLMVKWVRSEIVLTQDPNERAATMVKFIHIAQHARRLRNWATTYQITMALVGADCSRLKHTWMLVPDKELELLKSLETLILPTRNFHNLRMEMELSAADGAHGGEEGCIPFIGIYTHDLIYNSQKPMYVRSHQPQPVPARQRLPSSGAQEKYDNFANESAIEGEGELINFDRHHTAAGIVKNLLRHVEASSKYHYPIVPEVASRCLWVGSLEESEISRRSKELEPANGGRMNGASSSSGRNGSG